MPTDDVRLARLRSARQAVAAAAARACAEAGLDLPQPGSTRLNLPGLAWSFAHCERRELIEAMGQFMAGAGALDARMDSHLAAVRRDALARIDVLALGRAAQAAAAGGNPADDFPASCLDLPGGRAILGHLEITAAGARAAASPAGWAECWVDAYRSMVTHQVRGVGLCEPEFPPPVRLEAIGAHGQVLSLTAAVRSPTVDVERVKCAGETFGRISGVSDDLADVLDDLLYGSGSCVLAAAGPVCLAGAREIVATDPVSAVETIAASGAFERCAALLAQEVGRGQDLAAHDATGPQEARALLLGVAAHFLY